jgi:hypothetical protein
MKSAVCSIAYTSYPIQISVTVVSIIRLKSLIEFANSTNPTCEQTFCFPFSCLPSDLGGQELIVIGDYVPLGYWSGVEVNVGVICACLPAIRSLIVRACPGIFDSTVQGSRMTEGASKSALSASQLSSRISPRPKGDNSDFIPLVDVGH